MHGRTTIKKKKEIFLFIRAAFPYYGFCDRNGVCSITFFQCFTKFIGFNKTRYEYYATGKPLIIVGKFFI
jgi:hypothetical protein